MARTVTLTQLTSDITDQCDVTGATNRYPAALLTRFINQSIQRFRERLSSEGSQHYLVSTTGSLGVGVTSPYGFYVLDLSAVSPAIVRVYTVDIAIASVIRNLQYVPWESRNDYTGLTSSPSIPEGWTNISESKLAIMPASNQGYTYVAWYLPVLADLASGSDTFDGVAGWEDYIVWDVVCRLIARNEQPQAYALASAERDRSWADILRNATSVALAPGAHIARDTMGQRLQGTRRRKAVLPP